MSDDSLKVDMDLGLRHQPGVTPDEFIARYCEVFREHAHATQDDSLNEFEKLITHVLNMKIHYARVFELLGLKEADVRTIREVLEKEAVSDEGHTEKTLALREELRGIVYRIDQCVAESEEYRMLEENEHESIAKAIVMFHLIS